MTAQASESKLGRLEQAGMEEDEAAEILSAMLGLTPADGKKKRRSSSKVRIASFKKAWHLPVALWEPQGGTV